MGKTTREDPDILGAVTAGLIIILIAVLIVFTPNLLAHIINFFVDIAWTEITLGFWWWVPQNPGMHVIVYNAIYQFSLGTVAINVIVLILRVIFRDSYRRQIESIGGIVSSAGVTWAANNLILNNNFTVFSGYFIVFIGVSIIITSLGQWLVRYFGR